VTAPCVRLAGALCKRCAFYHPEVTRSQTNFASTEAGECRRCSPPVIGSEYGDEARAVGWPIVYGDDWCGEFEPDQESPAQ
jgi:hypothetical protein